MTDYDNRWMKMLTITTNMSRGVASKKPGGFGDCIEFGLIFLCTV